LRARRLGLSPEFITTASAALTEVVRGAPQWHQNSKIVGFVGIRGEPDTRALLRAALEEQRELWLPQVGPWGLRFARLHREEDLVPANFGLWEPPLDPRFPGRRLRELGPALLLIPGLGFTKAGGRLGFGAGYYDRALAEVCEDPAWVKMGLCFSPCLDPEGIEIPMADHDVPVSYVATELGLITCE